ncbi:MFS transporter [Halomonas sp. McH1-25]|uniref:MFS transporter n=1 Tax=unclassified Halomonas TaxID=2609666 RepID=UPI001EF43529|nr:MULTISPECIES: MFS transporter [unclassified Halomonas]MCG7601368.1 MFS transporter [Halomonas sp. McH1-25]MCP1343512.1 MFS transporter [Halomonas sp. FL8]MCP1361157.1 MFS transporter [Halomonas sp. BBD45]MCP1366730.1 MFS transporter [Halomonas sp. BBD48]
MSYRRLLKDRCGLLGIAFLAVFSGNMGQSFFIGLFQRPLTHHLEIGAGTFGTLYSIVSLIAGFIVLRLGPSLDWVSPRRFALAVLTGLFAGVLLMTLSPWLIAAVLGLGLVRLCGQGLLVHLGFTLAGREFGDQRGQAVGVASLGMPLGEIVLTPTVALLLVWLGWREAWWLFALVLIVAWLLLTLGANWPPAPQVTAAEARTPTVRPLRDARFWRLLPLLMILPVTMTGIFLYQAQMTDDLGAAAATYALALAGKGLARIPGALMGGRWVDQLGEQRLGRWYQLPFALALVIALTVGGDIAIWALMLGGGLVVGMQEPVANSLMVSLWGSEHLGRARAALSASIVFATGLSPAAFGILLDLDTGFATLLGGMLVLLVVSWLLAQGTLSEIARRPTPREWLRPS